MGSMSLEQPSVDMIAAYTIPARVLGDSMNPDGMPWGRKLTKDMRRFRNLTAENTMIVGANTLPYVETLNGTKGRHVIVVADPSRPIETQCIVRPDLQSAIKLVQSDPELYGRAIVSGGARKYGEFIELVDGGFLQKIGARALFHATEIYSDFTGDAYMPELGAGWVEVSREPQTPDYEGGPAYDFVTYENNNE